MASPKSNRIDWRAPAALLALSLVPVVAGIVRLHQLADGIPLKPDDARFFASPMPVILHIVAATLYAPVGALQFVPQLRDRKPWHRIVGRLVVACGIVTALTGLWMTQFYPQIPTDSPLLYGIRLIVGLWMLASLILALVAIRQRDFQRHGDWMIRA